jgi:hypothetical protein
MSEDLYEEYTEYVARQLALAPLGTRLATYHGICEEVHASNLLWAKTSASSFGRKQKIIPSEQIL